MNSQSILSCTTPSFISSLPLRLSSSSLKSVQHNHSSFTSTSTIRCRRRPNQQQQLVYMQAKIRKQQDTQQQSDDEKKNEDNTRSLDQILPPPILPTLTTLTDPTSITQQSLTPQPSSSTTTDKDKEKEKEKEKDILPSNKTESEKLELAQMGLGLSQQDENSIINFLKGVYYELQNVEWTAVLRVIRLTILVLSIIVVATSALYVVDGFLSRLSKLVFQQEY